MSKKRYIKDRNVLLIRQNLKTLYDNKYYNLFLTKYKFKELSKEENEYLLRKLWTDGTIAIFKDDLIADKIFFAPYATNEWNMYDAPAKITLINVKNSSVIPSKQMNVNEDVVIGYIMKTHKGVKWYVDNIINKIVDVEMVINTNLYTHKLPYFIGVTPEDENQVNAVIDKVFNDELEVCVPADRVDQLKTLSNGSPYIIDKLYNYKTSLENELDSFLGIDNTPSLESRMLVDQVNANNEKIKESKEAFEYCLNELVEDVKKVLNFTLTLDKIEYEDEQTKKENKDEL